MFKLIASMRVDGPATGGQATAYKLKPRGGGRLSKTAQYMVKIVAVSSAQAKVKVDLEHGPDGIVSKPHSTPIALTQLTGADANLLVGTLTRRRSSASTSTSSSPASRTTRTPAGP